MKLSLPSLLLMSVVGCSTSEVDEVDNSVNVIYVYDGAYAKVTDCTIDSNISSDAALT